MGGCRLTVSITILFFSPGPSRLLAHIRYRHMTVKPHECALCHKTFKTSHSLTEHIETHQETTTIRCSYPACTFTASHSRALDRHIQSVHTSSYELYCCHVCNKRFALGKKLTKHLKNDHGFQLPPGHCRFRYGFAWMDCCLSFNQNLLGVNWDLITEVAFVEGWFGCQLF